MRMSAEVLEAARDARPAAELLRGVAHMGSWDSRPDDHSDWWASARNYPFYAAVSSLVRPARVLEVGVRLGYSLISIFRGHPGVVWMVGIDTQRDFPGSQAQAAENLAGAGYRGRLDLPVGDVLSVHGFPTGTEFDLVHVDGSHTREDAERDIRELWPLLSPGGVLVADDTDYAPPVKEAVEAVKGALPGLAEEFYFPTFRGWWVAQRASRPE